MSRALLLQPSNIQRTIEVELKFFVSCGKGLEYLLIDELLALGASRATATVSGANVEGELVDAQFVELAVEVFSMLAEPTRVRIVLALRGGELPVNTIAAAVDKAPASVSQHLAKLRMARIVSTRQEGQRVFYRLENEHASQLVSDAIFQAEHSIAQGQPPAHHHQERERA